MADRQNQDYITINVKSLQYSFENIMRHNFSMSPECSIFRTPTSLYRQNEAAYKPRAFTFGPFHHEKQLEFAQKIKWEYLQGLLRRSTSPEELHGQLIGVIMSRLRETRLCYAESINFDDNKFAEILLFDGCFIIELFRKDAGKVTKDPYDPILTMACLQEYLNHDLILVENQIPWFVLESLFTLTKVSEEESLIQLAIDFFANIFSSDKPSVTPYQFQQHQIEVKHIIDLLWHALVLPLPPERLNQQPSGWEPIPSVTCIAISGIKFKRIPADSILDIRFRNGILEIPPLLIQETTETIFRNLISFEQCFPNYPSIVTSYARLMDNLIDAKGDVMLLCMTDTMDNWLNPEDAINFLKKLYYDTYVKRFYYHDICQSKLSSTTLVAQISHCLFP